MNKVIVLSLSLLTLQSFAQECTHLWEKSLEINPEGPKAMSGDTYAAYGLMGYHDKRNLRLRVEGQFLKGRFMSYESYKTKQKLGFDILIDKEMKAEDGSINPFVTEMNDEDTFNYTLDIVPEGSHYSSPNVLYTSKSTRVHSIFYRAYVPTGEVTEADMPRVYAYDLRTGQPTSCPKGINTVYKPGPIKILAKFIKAKREMEFKEGSYWNGTNHAIPKYVFHVNRILGDKTSVVRFKAPTYEAQNSTADAADTRYWSFCIQHLEKSQTLGCVPDFLAKPDDKGIVTVVVSKNQTVEKQALAKGYNFLFDKGTAEQPLLGFFYRNLLPNKQFAVYEGEYLPTGITCESSEYLLNGCGGINALGGSISPILQ